MTVNALGQALHGASLSRGMPAVRTVVCRASDTDKVLPRRTALLMGASLPVALAAQRSEALEQFELPVSQLGAYEKIDQRVEAEQAATAELLKFLSAADANKALRVVLNDASTFDYATKSGGVDGSIILNKAEAGRPENAGLADYISRLGKAKVEADKANAELGSEAWTWADFSALAVKVTTQAEWDRVKKTPIRTKWELRLGRLDSDGEPSKQVPSSGASAEEVRAFYNELGAKPGSTSGPFAGLPPFSEKKSFLLYSAAQDDAAAAEEKLAAGSPLYAKWKLDYDRARQGSRSVYEVDFIEAFNKLSALGAKFNPDAYLHPRIGYKYG